MSTNKSVDPAQEFKELLAQPFIDPITRYLQRYSNDAVRADILPELQKEQQRRCENVALRYSGQAKTPEVLNKLRAGYRFSCPQQEHVFALLLSDPNSSECYLLTELHDFTNAFKPCETAAKKGDMRAQLNMAVIDKAMKRYPEAIGWARKAADYFPEASYLLGEFYANGLGVEQDYHLAMKWYVLAASKGHTLAEKAVGVLYLQGKTDDPNPQNARVWLLRAASQNNAEAQFFLGQMCESGQVADADTMEAMVWYDLASQNGMSEARSRLRSLNQQIDEEKLKQAQTKVYNLLAGGL